MRGLMRMSFGKWYICFCWTKTASNQFILVLLSKTGVISLFSLWSFIICQQSRCCFYWWWCNKTYPNCHTTLILWGQFYLERKRSFVKPQYIPWLLTTYHWVSLGIVNEMKAQRNSEMKKKSSNTLKSFLYRGFIDVRYSIHICWGDDDIQSDCTHISHIHWFVYPPY